MKRLFPVIHSKDFEKVVDNIERTQSYVHGYFLINHNFHSWTFYKLVENVINRFPKINFGINVIDLPFDKLFIDEITSISGLKYIWTDNCGNDWGEFHDRDVERILKAKANRPHLELFGGFAFKYQQQPKDISVACVAAEKCVDIITTSGDGTGIEADLSKIQTIWAALNENKRLAIASGITPDNVDKYKPYVDDYLVATGISDDFYTLNTEKTKKLYNMLG